MDMDMKLRKVHKLPSPADYQDFKSSDTLTKKNYGTTAVGKEIRKSYFDTPVEILEKPGPGNYRVQSDFGMYCPTDVYGWA